MKSIDADRLEKLPGRRIRGRDTFSFRCHAGVACFNQCCRNLNLFLYPYDVMRLKNNLGLTSGDFLDRYVDVVLREGNYFPDVLLKMADNAERTCPFLQEEGCRVYPDRPDTCRTFPVEQGVLHGSGKSDWQRLCFFRPPDFCLGQFEDALWTLDSWAADQDAELFNQMTLEWSQVKALFHRSPWGSEGPDGPGAKMAFMATYNVDHFREFVLGSSFLKRYKVKSALLKKIRTDDLDMLRFGFAWVKLFVWGISSKKIRQR
jgi:Fe-S-cluster containining protein